MKLENQVCTLEQAKRLKELGVRQESLCHWTYYANNSNPHLICNGEIRDAKDLYKIHFCSAFTVAELGVMLPFKINDPKSPDYPDYDFKCARNYSEFDEDIPEIRLWSCCYEHEGMCLALFEPELTEASARAAMLTYLLENNLTTADEVNKRLGNQ